MRVARGLLLHVVVVGALRRVAVAVALGAFPGALRLEVNEPGGLEKRGEKNGGKEREIEENKRRRDGHRAKHRIASTREYV